ncbi:MAG: hypothetical protein RLY86_1804 [Pseudomonadota bacterium]|jgi:citrate lyase beta subunit
MEGVGRRRTLLFVPGNRPERFEKALAAGADSVCIDLEDAVPPGEKAAARRATLDFAARHDGPGELLVRLNPLRSADGIADLAAMLALDRPPAAVMLPKLSHAADLDLLDAVLGERATRVVPLVETAAGLAAADAIAAGPRVAALLFGAVDLSAELGCALDWEPLLVARSTLVRACAAAGVQLYDVPHIDVADEAGLAETTRRARALGFTGRACIHPRQVPVVNAAFTPSGQEIARARRILDAFAAAGGGVALLDGKLIEKPVARAAHRVLAAAGE